MQEIRCDNVGCIHLDFIFFPPNNFQVSWNNPLIKNLIVAQQVEKFSTFWGTRRLLTVLTGGWHQPCCVQHWWHPKLKEREREKQNKIHTKQRFSHVLLSLLGILFWYTVESHCMWGYVLRQHVNPQLRIVRITLDNALNLP